MNRAQRKLLGEETVAILERAAYTSAGGRAVDLRQALQRCVERTRVILPEAALLPAALSDAERARRGTAVEVTTESSLQAAHRLYELGKRQQQQPGVAAGATTTTTVDTERGACCLNFASAHNPGGGFLGGSQAQEESLARCSALYACQTRAGKEMYAINGRLPRGDARRPHTLYTHAMVYSPGVPVLRDEFSGRLLDEPFPVTFISAPAPNARATLQNFGRKAADPATLVAMVRRCLEERLTRVLALAQAEQHEALVLGAYGCGVFGNDTATVAQVFRDLLGGPFKGAFSHVVFAVYAKDEKDKTFATFKDILGSLPA